MEKLKEIISLVKNIHYDTQSDCVWLWSKLTVPLLILKQIDLKGYICAGMSDINIMHNFVCVVL